MSISNLYIFTKVKVGRGSTRVYPYQSRVTLRTYGKNKEYYNQAVEKKAVSFFFREVSIT